MTNDVDLKRKMIAILKTLEGKKEPVGAHIIARQLKRRGIELSERTVRYHLKNLDEQGFTQVVGKEGRLITKKGLKELERALAFDKRGMVIAKIENLSYSSTFDYKNLKGKVPLNISLLPQSYFFKAKRVLNMVFKKKLALTDRVAIFKPGEIFGEFEIPDGYFGLGTVCSVVMSGVLVKAGIPVTPRFGGLLEYSEGKPWRFTDLISYEGSTMDPLEVFIRSGMTEVRKLVKTGEGRILASFREFPSAALDEVKRIVGELKEAGFFGIIEVGKPSQPLFEAPVLADRVGLVVIGGLNPLAALEEAGISIENRAMGGLIEFEKLIPWEEI